MNWVRLRILFAVIAFVTLGMFLFIYNWDKSPFFTPAEKPDVLTSYIMTPVDRQEKKRSITLVTGLWDVGRNERPMTHYINWLKDTLGMDAKFIVFTDKATNAQLPVDKNKIVTVDMSLEDHPYYARYYERNKVILESTKYKKSVEADHLDNKSARTTLPGYNVIMWGKAKVLEIAAEMNPFESEYFVWVDAGLSRFWWPAKGDAATNVRWPSNDPEVLKNAFGGGVNGDRITITMQSGHKWKDTATQACTLPYSGLFVGIPGIAGGIIGGTKKAIRRFRGLQEKFVDDMLATGVTATDEQIRPAMNCVDKTIFRVMSASTPRFAYSSAYGFLDVHRSILDGKIEIEEAL